MAYYGGEEQRKKDLDKASIEKQSRQATPKRRFDPTGRELDPRSGKLIEDWLSEKYKSFPADKVTRKVKALDAEKAMGLSGDTHEKKAKNAKRRMKMDMAVYVDKDPELRSMHRSAKQTIEKNNRERGRQKMEEQLDGLLSDPLEDFFSLYEAEMGMMQKPQIETDQPSAYGGPNDGNYQHPVAMKRAALDAEMQQGHDPVEAHQKVNGDVDLADTTSKKMLAGTLGRVQDESSKNGIRMEPEKGSLLYKDYELEKTMGQVSHDDMRTPMRGQVPDRLQTPADEVAEEIDYQEEIDYNDDVAYLQKYGRA